MISAADYAPVIASTIDTTEWFALFDRDLHCVHLHRGALGRIPERLIGAPGAEPSAAALSALGRELAIAVITDGTAQDTEIPFEDPRFGPRRFEFEFRALRSSDDVVGVLVRSAESTNRRMHARALRLQTRLLECMTDAVLVVDAQRIIRFANLACEALFVSQPGRLIGEPVSSLGKTISACLTGLREAGAEETHGQGTLLALEPAAAPAPLRVVRCRISALYFDEQRYDLVVLNDVTELHRLERDVLDAETHERQRLARDLHDGLGQELTGLALMLRALDTQRPSSSPPAASAIQPIIDVVNGVIRSVRSMTGGIFARAVAEGGLPSALLRLAQSSTERSNVAVECRVHLPPDYLLEPSRADHLYHIAQEATTNALRHGGAAHILIELALDAAGLRLTIADDGCGITAEREAAGNGLHIMRYRAAAASGELRIERGMPRGTRVEYRAMPPRAANPH